MTPLIYITSAFISGVVLGRLFLYFPYSVFILLTIILLFFSVVFKKKVLSFLGIYVVAISGFLYYIFTYTYIPKDHITLYIGEEVMLKGKILRPPEIRSDKVSLHFGVEEVSTENGTDKVSGKVRLTGRLERSLRYGDIILVNTKLKELKDYHNPGGYSFEEALWRDRIKAIGWVKEEDISRIGVRETFLRRLYDKRENIRKAIEGSLSQDASAILQAMIVGDERGLTDEIRDVFMISGTTHILSISGSHLGLLAFLIYNLVRLLILRLPQGLLLRLTIYSSPSKIAAVATMPPVILYSLIAGAEVATVRSLIMILMYLFATVFERENKLINSLALAALAVLVSNPQALFDISFQLSYGSILSIGYFLLISEGKKNGFKEIEEDMPIKIKKRLFQYLLVAFAATVGTAPLVAYHFNQFTWVGLFSNIVVIPLAGAVIVPLGLLSGFIVAVTGSLQLPLAFLNERVVSLFYSIVKIFSGLPYAAAYLPSPSILIIGLFYISIYTAINWKRNKWIKAIGVSTISLIIILILPLALQVSDKNLKVTFIDVGQGDSSLVELPDGKRMLIDGGGAYDIGFDIGRRVLAPYLWDKGIRRIDYLVVSHPHPDHIKGLFYVIKKIRIGEAWIADHSLLSDGYSEILNLLKERNIPVLALKRGDAIFKDDYKIYILHPYPEFYPDSQRGEFSEQNNCSLVLKIVYKTHSLLFTGDVEEEAEYDLIHLGDWLRADIIKVPHHGGRTSSGEGFLFYVRPSIAVVSSGRDNIFRHPNHEVIRRYEEFGAELYRTDRDGAVMVGLEGGRLNVKTFNIISLEMVHFGKGEWNGEVRNIKRIFDSIPIIKKY